MAEMYEEQRNCGIDLLRILAMYMVVIMHILGVGGVLNGCERLSAEYCIAWFLEATAYSAVNCYALISGFVGIESKYRYSNIVLLWLRVVFYTVVFAVLFGVFLPDAVEMTTYIKAFFPVFKSSYWYFSSYFCLFFMIPILNAAIIGMTKKQLKYVVTALFVLFSALQTVFGDRFGTNEGYSALWLVILYVFGAYIKKFSTWKQMEVRKAIVGYGLMVILSWGFKIGIEVAVSIGDEDNLFVSMASTYSERLVRYISPTMLFAAIFLLIAFGKLQISGKLKRIIMFFSPLAFSVYIIHAHPLVWDYFIKDKFADIADMTVPLIVLFVLGTAGGIYIICSMIDVLREYLFKIINIKKVLSRLEEEYIGGLWSDKT